MIRRPRGPFSSRAEGPAEGAGECPGTPGSDRRVRAPTDTRHAARGPGPMGTVQGPPAGWAWRGGAPAAAAAVVVAPGVVVAGGAAEGLGVLGDVDAWAVPPELRRRPERGAVPQVRQGARPEAAVPLRRGDAHGLREGRGWGGAGEGLGGREEGRCTFGGGGGLLQF